MRRPLQHALDELRFGPTRTLNLRTSLPTAADAARRAEAWLRTKQAEGVREVLVITGRGNQSYGQVPVVREAVRRLLSTLARQGVVADVREHTSGSFAIRLAPFGESVSQRAARRVDRGGHVVDAPTLDGLSDATRERLCVLAIASLNALGLRNPPPAFVQDEMIRQCALLGATLPPGTSGVASADTRERQLVTAIERALDALHDDRR